MQVRGEDLKKYIPSGKIAPDAGKSNNKVLNLLNDAVQRLDVVHVHELLESKPNLNTNFGGRLISYVMFHALDEEFDDHVVLMTKMLVKAGAKLNMSGTNEYKRFQQDPRDYEFLHLVACRADKEDFLVLAKVMMDHGANVMARNESGDTPLHIAAEIGCVALAKELVKRGADPEALNNDNHDPIQVAIAGVLEGITKSDEMLPVLIKAGNADEKTIKRRGTLAFRYSLYEARNLTEPMKVVFDLGIPVDALDDDCDNLPQFYWPGHECRPLNYAAHWQHLATVELLAKLGADINKHSKCGRSAITVAFQRSNPITIQCLIRLGADVNNCNKDDGQYPLHNVCYSVDYHTPSTIEFLLNLGANINVKEKNGKTPLAFLVKETKFGESYKVIIRHIAFLLSTDMEVNKNDLQIIKTRPKAKEYYEKCLSELEKMKRTTIYNDISVFDLIAKSDKVVSLFIKNKDFSKSYSLIKASFRSEFPEYFVKLKNKIELVKQLRVTSDKQKNILDKTVQKMLPEITLDKIVDFIDEKLKREFYVSVYRSDMTKAGYTAFADKCDEE